MSTVAVFSRSEFVDFYNKFLEVVRTDNYFAKDDPNWKDYFDVYCGGKWIWIDRPITAKDLPYHTVSFGFPEYPTPIKKLYPYFKDCGAMYDVFDIWGIGQPYKDRLARLRNKKK